MISKQGLGQDTKELRDNVANREKDSNLTLTKSTSENSDFQTAEETFFNSVNIPKTKVTVNNKSVGKSKVTANDNFTTLTIDDSILIKEQLSTPKIGVGKRRKLEEVKTFINQSKERSQKIDDLIEKLATSLPTERTSR